MLLRNLLLPSLKLSVHQAASEMGVARQTVYRILAGQAGISPDMALRLARLSGTRAEAWLDLQQRHDLWRVKQDLEPVLAAIPVHELPRSFTLTGEVRHER